MFCGVFSALITPFLKDLSVDYVLLDKIIESQLQHNLAGFVILGTTSESTSLSEEEKHQIIDFVINKVNGRCKIIVGIVGNNTKYVCDSIVKYNKFNKIDGYLIVVPYYNKPTQEGLYLHFNECAKVSESPIILYNVFSRCGVSLHLETILKLSSIDNIVGIKECSNDINYIMHLCKAKPKGFNVLCGEDSLLCNYLMLGASGCISVASQIIPSQIVDIYQSLSVDNDYQKSVDILYKNLNLINFLFKQTNPIPIKSLLSYVYKGEEYLNKRDNNFKKFTLFKLVKIVVNVLIFQCENVAMDL